MAGALAASAGLVFVLVCGVLTTLLAANRLDAPGYTVYAAFSGVLGVLVLSPAAALEQEAALRGRTSTAGAVTTLRALAPWLLAVWVVALLALLVPVGGWQERLLAPERSLVAVVLAVAAPALVAFTVLRGHALGRGRYRLLTAVHAVSGAGLVAAPLLLRGAGNDWLDAFVIGAVVGYALGLVLLLVGVAVPSGPPPESALRAAPRHRSATAWVVLSNILLIANLLAAPVVLRWHVADVGAAVTASVQLLVSASRLSTTAVLGFLPLVVAVAAGRVSSARATTALSVGTGAAVGVLTLVVCLLAGPTAVLGLTGRSDGMDGLTVLLAAAPVVLLCPAVVLLGLALAAGRHAVAAGAWASGLLVLLATAAVDPGGDVRRVLGGILLASALPLVVLTLGGAGRSAAPQACRVPAAGGSAPG